MEEKSKKFLEEYLSSLSTKEVKKYTSLSSDYFCADEYNANMCVSLVLSGEKKATCSLDYWYSHKNEKYPEVGHLQVVTNWNLEPICINRNHIGI